MRKGLLAMVLSTLVTMGILSSVEGGISACTYNGLG